MKKKVSGQTIAIIILAILLLIVLAFGSVYAIYNTNTDKISGRIIMANLKIEFGDTAGSGGSSGSNGVWFSFDAPVVPNEPLKNTPLVITNESNTPIYIALFYKLDVKRLADDSIVDYDLSQPIIDVGADGTNGWLDYYFQDEEQDIQARCLVLVSPSSAGNITAIAENKLKLHELVGNDFQSCSLKFTFQAYAIAANSFNFEDKTQQEICNEIVKEIFVSHNYELDIYQ